MYLSKLDGKLGVLCEQYSQGERRKQNSQRIALMKARQQVLEQGEADPSCRANLQRNLRMLNQQILRTPAAAYSDPAYARVKFLRYANDVAVGLIGPKTLAEHL